MDLISKWWYLHRFWFRSKRCAKIDSK